MDIVTYIVIIIFVTFLSIGGIYALMGLMGPRKAEEIKKLIEQGRIREAAQLLDKLLEKDDRDMHARYLLSICHQKEGNHPAAVMEFRQCIKIGKYSPEAPEIKIRKALAESLIQIGNKNDAKNEYLILTTLQPEVYQNFYQVGKLYYSAGIYQKSLKFLNKSAQLNSNHGDTQTLLGQAQFHLGSYQDARATLARAVQLKSEFKTARYYFGLALRFTGDLDWALKELEKAEREESIRDRVLLAKGMVLIDQEGYSAAITELDRALKYAQTGSDTSIQIRYLIALASEKNRDIHRAIENWEAVERMKPGYRDVKEKIRQYSEFKTDDSIKDVMTAGTTQFEGICRKLVESMNFQIAQVNIVNDSRIHILAADEDKLQIGARNKYTMFWIQREVNAVNENQIRDFQVKMKENNAGRGIIMTTGEFTPGALNYASTRPLDLYDTNKLTEVLKGVDTQSQ